jgi:hypothetical protein
MDALPQMVPTPDAPPQATTTISPLTDGDARAKAGDWVAAVSAWEAALTTADHERASARLRWFAEQMAPGQPARKSRRLTLTIPIGVATAVTATVLVLIAESRAPGVRNALATLAWFLYVVAAGCGLAYAFQYRPKRVGRIDQQTIRLARELAQSLQHGSATMADGRESFS